MQLLQAVQRGCGGGAPCQAPACDGAHRAVQSLLPLPAGVPPHCSSVDVRNRNLELVRNLVLVPQSGATLETAGSSIPAPTMLPKRYSTAFQLAAHPCLICFASRNSHADSVFCCALQDKPASEFHRSRSYKDGLFGQCRSCCAAAAARRAKPLVSSRLYRRLPCLTSMSARLVSADAHATSRWPAGCAKQLPKGCRPAILCCYNASAAEQHHLTVVDPGSISHHPGGGADSGRQVVQPLRRHQAGDGLQRQQDDILRPDQSLQGVRADAA